MVQKSSFFFQTEMSLFFDLDLLSLLPEDKFMILKFVVCVCVCVFVRRVTEANPCDVASTCHSI